MKLVIILFALIIAGNCQFQYDEEVAKDLAGFSIIAYCNHKGILFNNCGAPCNRNPKGFSDYNFLTNAAWGNHAVIGYSPDHDAIVVTFRGSLINDLGNIIRDLSIWRVPYPFCAHLGCNVHLGFYSHFQDLQNQANYYFKLYRAKYPNAKLYITGHSLGAATATISLPYFYEWNGYKKIDAFYSFSSPRIGDKAYSDWFRSQNFATLYGRITHHNDPIVQNPTSWFPLFFYHTHQEVYYPNFNVPSLGYKLCYYAEDTSCGAQQNYFALDINDHMNLYGWSLSQAGTLCNT